MVKQQSRDNNTTDDSNSSFTGVPSEINENETPEIAKHETRLVSCSKFGMICVLIISALSLSQGTYIFLTNVNKTTFENKFEDYASEIIQVSQFSTKNIFTATENFARTVTSYAIGSNSTWPFVTISGFEAMAAHFRQQIKTRYVIFGPIVEPHQRLEWEQYSVENHRKWVNESFDFIQQDPPPAPVLIFPKIYRIDFSSGNAVPYIDDVPPDPVYAPIWQIQPISEYLSYVNYNGFDGPVFAQLYPAMIAQREAIVSKAIDLSGYIGSQEAWPQVTFTTPIFERLDDNYEKNQIVGALTSFIPWHLFFENIAPGAAAGITMVVKNCDQTFSYKFRGPTLQYLGEGDLHDDEYDHLEISAAKTKWITAKDCPYSLYFYPSDEFQQQFDTDAPLYYSFGVLLVFFITAISFIVYDCVARSSTNKVQTRAEKSNAIVDSFVPSNVRERLLENEDQTVKNNDGNSDDIPDLTKLGKPIADLHPHCTVMFADIVNFTTWSSVREPSQVIALLEAIYSEFDELAKRRGVFKIETNGDCYVAVVGLPKPRDDHAVVMAKFANACLFKLKGLVSKLETYLGPGTSEIGMRFGLHSGGVTAGVLRGDVMRFQLVGVSVNMTNMMQETGIKNQIHISKATAELLQQAGKGEWVIPRDDMVSFPGKGKLQTYWLQSTTALDASLHPDNKLNINTKASRLVNWNVDILSRLLKQTVAARDQTSVSSAPNKERPSSMTKLGQTHDDTHNKSVLDEVKEIISLPNKVCAYKCPPASVKLGSKVVSQLRNYVETIASMYRDNHFHSFEHACQVSQSLSKLLSRIVTSAVIDYGDMKYKKKADADTLHKQTFGITSDPIIQFACAFSALIHDVDHRGIPNIQLIKEEMDLATLYKHKSVAEQNSVDLAWDVLMQDEFEDLRNVIYTTQEEKDRFRQLVVNSVMATDIVDKELGALRKNRWNKAFSNDVDENNNDQISEMDEVNRKATIVIEHLIQAADVNHTMQHWKVYLKWNEKFFKEMYQAYLDGRADKDPSIGWYRGEIGFFDYYIIPLAKKLESCGVFGVSSAECLDYAISNRNEWELKGESIVKGYLESFEG